MHVYIYMYIYSNILASVTTYELTRLLIDSRCYNILHRCPYNCCTQMLSHCDSLAFNIIALHTKML